MATKLFATILIYGLFLVNHSIGQDIPKLVCRTPDDICTCGRINEEDDSRWKIDCTNSRLNTTLIAPMNDTERYVLITFENGKLTELKRDHLSQVHSDHVETLNFGNNRISKIEKKAFDKLTSLKVLILKHNKLETVDADWFDGLALDLLNLDLSDNDILKVPDNAFKHLTILEYLDLDGNGISNITNSTFMGLAKLRELSLDRNLIENISDNAFTPMNTRLETLSISKNRKLNSLPVLKNMNALNKVIFDNTNLTTIPSNAFIGAPCLTDISFDFMANLTRLEKCAFCGLPKLNFVRISDSPKLKSITDEHFDAGFGFNGSVGTLDFSNNSLTTLVLSKLVSWRSVRTLYLAGNMWNCSCSIFWMSDVSVNIVDQPRCFSPKPLQGQLIRSLTKSSFGDCRKYVVVAYQTPRIFIAMTMVLLVSGAILISWYIWSSRKQGTSSIAHVLKTNPLSKQPYAYRNLAMNQDDSEQVIQPKPADDEEDDAPYPPFDKDSRNKANLV